MTKENSILFLGDVAAYHAYRFKSGCKTVINLECPLTNKGTPSEGKIILGAGENFLKEIFGSDLLAVNLGNNHILDYGLPGLNSTIAELENSGIRYFGLENLPGNNPLILESNNTKIAFISAICESTSPVLEHDNTRYLAPLETGPVIEKIKKVRNEAGRIVIYIHWGYEESSMPSSQDISIARKLIDEGADIIIGSHAHAPQPFERYRNGIIAYNLGNFIMPEMKNAPSYFDSSGIARSTFSRRLMIWNRISWGVEIDMETMEFKVRRFMFNRHRVVELPFTPLDGYIMMRNDISTNGYDQKIRVHLKRRNLQRRLAEFIHNPHVPNILRPKR